MHEQQAQTVSPCLWFCIITVTRTETVYEVGSNWSRPGFEDLQDCAPKTFCSSLKLLFPWSCHSLELLIWGKSTSSCLLDDNTQTSISSKEWKVRGTFIPWIFRFAPRSKVCWCFLGRQLNGSVKEPNKFHNYETEKITPKARVTRQNISNCLVLPSKIVMHDTFHVILWTSADIWVDMHDDLRCKNWTTLYSCRFSATSLALQMIFDFRLP